MTQAYDNQAGARIDPMRQPPYQPSGRLPPREPSLMSQILEALKASPLNLQGLLKATGKPTNRISPVLSDAKSRGLVVAEDGPPAIYRLARPDETPSRPAVKPRGGNAGLRDQIRQILAAEGALTVAALLERFPGVTRTQLVDNIRKWELDGGCRRIATLDPKSGPLVCLPEEEECALSPAPAVTSSTLSSTPPSEARVVAVDAVSPASESTASPVPAPPSPEVDPMLLNNFEKAYWALEEALDQYVDQRLSRDPVYVAMATAVLAAETAVRKCRRST